MAQQTTFFLVAQKTTSAPSTALFIQKNLSGTKATTVHDVDAIAKRDSLNIGHTIFMSVLPAAIKAYRTSATIWDSNQSTYFNFFPSVPFSPLMSIPKVTTRMTGPDLQTQEAFFEKFGFEKVSMGKRVEWIGTPSPAFMKAASESKLEMETYVDRGMTNIAGFIAYIKISKIVTVLGFLVSVASNNFDDMISFVRPHDPDSMDTDSSTMSGFHHAQIPLGSTRVAAIGEIPSNIDLVNACTALGNDDDGRIAVAPIQRDTPCNYFGTTEGCPFSEGIPIPYFQGSIISDMRNVVDFLQKHLHGLFGTDMASACASFKAFRQGQFFLAGTVEGMMLSHMVECLRLAMEAGCAIYFVLEGSEYLGSVLGPGNYSILRKNQVFRPQTGESFRSSLGEITGNTHRIRLLAELLSRMHLLVKDSEGKPTKKLVSTEHIKTTRDVFALCQLRSGTTDTEGENAIEACTKLLERITFSNNYLAPTSKNILQAFKHYASSFTTKPTFWDISQDLYLPAAAFSKSYAVHILSAFGVYAPSLLAASGDQMVLPGSDDRAKDSALQPHSKFPDYKEMVYVAFHMKLVPGAAADMITVVEKKAVRYQTGSKGGPVKCSGRFTGADRDELWYGLGDLVKGMTGKEAAGKKRKAEKDSNEVVKKRKLDMEAQLFLDAMW